MRVNGITINKIEKSSDIIGKLVYDSYNNNIYLCSGISIELTHLIAVGIPNNRVRINERMYAVEGEGLFKLFCNGKEFEGNIQFMNDIYNISYKIIQPNLKKLCAELVLEKYPQQTDTLIDATGDEQTDSEVSTGAIYSFRMRQSPETLTFPSIEQNGNDIQQVSTPTRTATRAPSNTRYGQSTNSFIEPMTEEQVQRLIRRLATDENWATTLSSSTTERPQ